MHANNLYMFLMFILAVKYWFLIRIDYLLKKKSIIVDFKDWKLTQ